MVNWDKLVDQSLDVVIDFAEKKISGDTFYYNFQYTPCAGDARNLIRSGVQRGRQLARKALRYRCVNVETPSGR